MVATLAVVTLVQINNLPAKLWFVPYRYPVQNILQVKGLREDVGSWNTGILTLIDQLLGIILLAEAVARHFYSRGFQFRSEFGAEGLEQHNRFAVGHGCAVLGGIHLPFQGPEHGPAPWQGISWWLPTGSPWIARFTGLHRQP